MKNKNDKILPKKYTGSPARGKIKEPGHSTPLLCALTVSMLCTSIVSAVGAHGIYQKYDTEGWSQPVVAVLMQGLAHQKYPWNASPDTGSGTSSIAAGSQSDTLDLPVSYMEQPDTPPSRDTSPGGTDSPITGNPSPENGSSPAGDAISGQNASSARAPSLSGQIDPVQNNQPSGTNLAAEDASSEPKQYEFTQVTQEYFDDALLIGDSRAEGIKLYSGWDNLTCFAEGGMTIYNMFQSQSAQTDEGKTSVEQALQNGSYGKIYLEIGINEMGTGNVDSFMEAYESAVTRLQELQPDAILFLCGIMYVKQSKSESDPIFNNPNIQARNDRIAQLADQEKIFYLDINELLADETGNLNPEYTWDEVHLLGKYNTLWLDYFCSHGILTETP